MGKLIKYEIRGTYRFILGVLALVMILTSGIYIYMNNVMEMGGSLIGPIFTGLSFMLIFASMISIFFYIVNSFRKELYEDRGYLTFTLPLTGGEILGAKLLAALLWFAILSLGLMVSNGIGLKIILPADLWNSISLANLLSDLLVEVRISSIIASLLFGFISGLLTLLSIYFAMALSRVTFKNRKLKGFWFPIFLVLSLIISIGQIVFTEVIPYYINVTRFGIESRSSLIDSIESKFGSIERAGEFVGEDGTAFVVTNNLRGDTLVHLGTSIYFLLIVLTLFMATSRLIERKIDI